MRLRISVRGRVRPSVGPSIDTSISVSENSDLSPDEYCGRVVIAHETHLFACQIKDVIANVNFMQGKSFD